MNHFTFTVDDNIRFLRDISAWTEQNHTPLLGHPYLAMWKRLHDAYGVKVQLNLFEREGDFDLSKTTERFKTEFASCSDWLKLSFHSKQEFPTHPYRESGYDEMLTDCLNVQNEILRFAGDRSLAKTTTVHYAEATEEGESALKACGIKGLMGLYGTDDAPRTSYTVCEKDANELRHGIPQYRNGLWHFPISCVLNTVSLPQIGEEMKALKTHPFVGLMIHEQYFYSDYPRFQADFEEKVTKAVKAMREQGRISCFAEELCVEESAWK